MKFFVKKENLFNGIRIVENATSIRTLQPVFSNILIETIDKKTIRLIATDSDISISTIVEAQVEEEGKITLPSKKLNEIAAKQDNSLIQFVMEKDSVMVSITSQKSKYEIEGISANEFPQETYEKGEGSEYFEIEYEPFLKAMKQASFAAATYETSNLLSGICCNISGQSLEVASTDGNRLAKKVEKINNKENKTAQLIIPAKTINEFTKMSTYIEDDFIKLYVSKNSKITIQTEKITINSRLMEGQYPKYNQLIPIPQKEAIINKRTLLSAIERVAIMVDEKNIIKMNFQDNELTMTAHTPEIGKSEEKIEIKYTSEPLLIAFNYKYWLDVLKNTEAEEVKIGLGTGLSTTVLKPNTEEDFTCLIMPIQIR